MVSDINLLDFVAQEDIQRFQESLFEAIGIISEITDLQGNPLCGQTVEVPFCALMQEYPGTASFCIKHKAALAQSALETTASVSRQCANLGMISVYMPIIIGDVHVANWKLGRVRIEELPESTIREFAEANKIPPNEVLTAYNNTPLLSDKEFFDVVRFLELSAEMLSEKAYKNHLLQKTHGEKDRLLSILSTVMDNVDALVYINDPQTHKLKYTNRYARAITGESHLEGALCYEVIQKRDSPCPFCPHTEIFTKDGRPSGKMIRSEFHNAQLKRDFIITDKTVPWYDGSFMHMQIAVDITERNELLAVRAGTLAQRDFLARMSHTLRSPVNNVLSMAELALNTPPSQDQQEHLKRIRSSATALLGMVNDILDFSQIETGKLVVKRSLFNVHDTIMNATELVIPRAREKGIGFIVSIDDSVPAYVIGDSVRISQVLLSLVANAVKFTNEGMVAVAVQAATPAPGKIRLQCRVKDSGVGIEPEDTKKLFAPFGKPLPRGAAATREPSGVGLGLAITQKLVELMGGEIAVSSTPGKGSSFSFTVLLEATSIVDKPRACYAFGSESF